MTLLNPCEDFGPNYRKQAFVVNKVDRNKAIIITQARFGFGKWQFKNVTQKFGITQAKVIFFLVSQISTQLFWIKEQSLI